MNRSLMNPHSYSSSHLTTSLSRQSIVSTSMSGDNSIDLLESVFNAPQNDNISGTATTFTSNKSVPPPIQTDLADLERDDGNFAIFSPAKSKARSLTLNVTRAEDDFEFPCQGMVLGRVSMRSLLMRDWTPFFYVIKKNCDIRYYEDSNFLKHNSPDDSSILIYRER